MYFLVVSRVIISKHGFFFEAPIEELTRAEIAGCSRGSHEYNWNELAEHTDPESERFRRTAGKLVYACKRLSKQSLSSSLDAYDLPRNRAMLPKDAPKKPISRTKGKIPAPPILESPLPQY